MSIKEKCRKYCIETLFVWRWMPLIRWISIKLFVLIFSGRISYFTDISPCSWLEYICILEFSLFLARVTEGSIPSPSTPFTDILACFKAYKNFYHHIFKIHLSMSSEKGWDFGKMTVITPGTQTANTTRSFFNVISGFWQNDR